MTAWRVQRYAGEKLVRDWRWLWLRMKSVPQWQTFAVTELEARMALNAPSTFDLRFTDPMHNLVLDKPTPTP